MTSPSKRVLLVDSSEQALKRLSLLARENHPEWDVAVARSGQEALAFIRESQPQAIISDPAICGVGGAPLLADIKENYPQIARIAFSEATDPKAAIRANPAAQQVISRACDGTSLRVLVERTYNLQKVLSNRRAQRVIGDLERLPSVPRTYWALVDAAAEPDADMMDIAKIIQSDPAMSLKVLQLVNSAFFGLSRRVTSIEQAVGILGIELLKGLTLSAQVFMVMEVQRQPNFSLEQFQSYAIRVAQLAKRFLPDKSLSDEAFTAGLMHDIGQLVIAVQNPRQFAAIVNRVASTNEPFEQVEQELLDVTHAEVGALLLATWGIPFSIVECVAFHHCPSTVPPGPSGVLAAVHAAAILLQEHEHGEPKEHLDMEFLERNGFAAELPHWRELVTEMAA